MKQHIVRSNKNDLSLLKEDRSSSMAAVYYTHLPTESHTEQNVKKREVLNLWCLGLLFFAIREI